MQTQSIQSLAQKLKSAQLSQSKRFIFFLGAGASESSGIPTASWMIHDFDTRLKKLWNNEGKPDDSFESWLESKPGWKTNDSDYARYFEVYEPTEHGRVRYLNDWMQLASPGWGYFCLSQLLANSYLGTVVTTNFDDLIYDACTLYSVNRPRVYSTSNPYRSFDHGQDRTTVIKLHGDYLYANFKNTLKETRQLDRHLMTEVASLFQHHEIVVAGYSGSDRRIVRELFAKVPPPNAVYWCTYQDSSLPELVTQSVSKRRLNNWFLVRTNGFDDFMDELMHRLNFSIPSIVQPIQALINAIPGRVEGSNSRYTLDYLDEAIHQLSQEEADLAQAFGVESMPTPYRLRLEAMSARLNRQYDQAIEFYHQLSVLPIQATTELLIEYAVTLELMDKYTDALQLVAKIEKPISSPDELGNYGWLLASLGKYDEGIRSMRQAIDSAPGLRQWQSSLVMLLAEDAKLDKALAYAHQLNEMYPNDSQMWANRSMIHRLAGDYPTALDHANKAVRLSPNGLVERLSHAFALSGVGNQKDAISTLDKIDEGKENFFYRANGYFHILTGDADTAIATLEEAIQFERPAVRPKTMILHAVALLLKGNDAEARVAFEKACPAQGSERRYKIEDELAIALCQLGAGQDTKEPFTVIKLSREYSHMQGLLKEIADLLRIMARYDIKGSDSCLEAIESTLDSAP